MSKVVVLVSCVGEKLPRSAPAADLYISPWYQKARKYARSVSDVWYILSAEYGVLVPPRDIPALANALETVLRDAALRTRLGQSAQARARDVFSVARMARDYVDLYRTSQRRDAARSPTV